MRRAAGLIAPLLIAGCAAPAAEGEAGGRCFWASQVTGFTDAGRDSAVVNIGLRESWRIELGPGCPDVDWAMAIAIRSRGSERICSGRDAELIVPTASERGSRRCLVRGIRQLSDAEAATVRGLDRP